MTTRPVSSGISNATAQGELARLRENREVENGSDVVYVTLGMTESEYFVHRPEFSYKTQRFGYWMCFRLQVRERETPTVLGRLENTNQNLWTRSTYRNVVF
jgi:hypothetical protein